MKGVHVYLFMWYSQESPQCIHVHISLALCNFTEQNGKEAVLLSDKKVDGNVTDSLRKGRAYLHVQCMFYGIGSLSLKDSSQYDARASVVF